MSTGGHNERSEAGSEGWRKRLLVGIRRLFLGSVQRTLVLLLVAIFLGLAVEEVTQYRSLFDEERQEEYQSDLEVARFAATAFGNFVTFILDEQKELAGYFSPSQPFTQDRANALLASGISEAPAVRYYAFVNPQGRVVASTDLSTVGWELGNVLDLDEIARGREWVVTNLFQTGSGDQATFLIARAARDESGTLRGTVACGIDPDKLGSVLRVQRVQEGTIVMVDGRGMLAYIYPEARPSWEERNPLPSEPLLSKALAGEEVTGDFVSNIDGLERMAGYVPIPEIGWVARASRPTAAVVAPILDNLYREAAADSVILLAALLVAFVISRNITVPLRRLQGHASAIGRGEFGPALKVAGPVELDATITSIADGVVIYGPTGEIVRMNGAAEYFLGFTPAERGLSLAERMARLRAETADGKPFSPEQHPVYRAIHGEAVSGVVIVAHQPQASFWLSVSAAPIRAPDGRQLGAVSVITDITAQHQLQEWLQDLIRMVSHDLRNPLLVIQGQAQMLLRMLDRAGLTGNERRSAEAIVTGARRMNAMIQDLIDSARLESGQFLLQRQPVGLKSCLSDLLERARGSMDISRIKVEMPDDLPPVLSDTDRLERIFTNLLTNALKYSAPQTEVVVRAARTDDKVIVSIIDRGVGIAPEDMAHLFERFYRTRGARKVEGLGLGLYISKTIPPELLKSILKQARLTVDELQALL